MPRAETSRWGMGSLPRLDRSRRSAGWPDARVSEREHALPGHEEAEWP